MQQRPVPAAPGGPVRVRPETVAEPNRSGEGYGALPGWLASTLLVLQNACLIGGMSWLPGKVLTSDSSLHRACERCLAVGRCCTAARRRCRRVLRTRAPVLSLLRARVPLLLQSVFQLRLRLRIRIRGSLLSLWVSVSVWGVFLRPHARVASPGHTAPGGGLHRRLPGRNRGRLRRNVPAAPCPFRRAPDFDLSRGLPHDQRTDAVPAGSVIQHQAGDAAARNRCGAGAAACAGPESSGAGAPRWIERSARVGRLSPARS